MSDQPKPATTDMEFSGTIATKPMSSQATVSNDQPKPATGEWTVEFENMIYAGDEFIAIITDYESRIRVVKMHNAALAAEREKFRDQWEAGYQSAAQGNEAIEKHLREQLAAEQDSHYKIHEDLASVRMHRDATLDQLTYEREKVQNLEKTLQLVAEILGASPK